MQKRGMSNRGISNLVATVVIILMCIILSVSIYNNLIPEVKKSTSNIEKNIEAITDINLNIVSVDFSGNDLRIVVENSGKQDISGFMVRVTSSENEIYLNNSVYIQDEQKLKPLETRYILIIPAPFGTDSLNYSLIEVYPKFVYQGKVEISEAGKASFSMPGSIGRKGADNTPRNNLEVKTCGDGICDLRKETNFDCPLDCNSTYYIVDKNNPSCSDSGSGTLDKPFCTIYKSSLIVNPGDTVYIRGGIQAFGEFFYIDRGGEPGKYVSFRNYPGEYPILESGVLFNSGWSLETGLSSSEYNIFSLDIVLGLFNLSSGADNLNYPYKIYHELDIPLSRLVRLSDLTNLTSLEGVLGSFDAYYFNCSSGKVYLRFSDKNSNPNNDKIYFDRLFRRLYIRASYIKIINLTMQHGIEGVKMNPPPSSKPDDPIYKKVTQHVEIYDSYIVSVATAVGDHAGSDLAENYFVFDNNKIINSSAEVEIDRKTGKNGEIGDSRGYKCIEELDAERDVNGNPIVWKYTHNRWDHVVYGGSRGDTFSNNYVDTNGVNTALTDIRNFKIYNNFILGDVLSYSSEPAEIYNNTIINLNGAPLGLFKINNTLVYNNILIGTNLNAEYPGLVRIGDNDAGVTNSPDLYFKNNIIQDLNPSEYSNCLVMSNYRNYPNLDMDNNVYIGCDGWKVLDSSGKRRSFFRAENGFSQWQSFMNPNEKFSSAR